MTLDHQTRAVRRRRPSSRLTVVLGLWGAILVGAMGPAAAWAEDRGAAATEEPAAHGPTVRIDNFTFTPARLVVRPGETVTWVNADDIPHTVVSSARIFKSRALDTDDTFAFTFVTTGSYEYFCSLHPHMRATIVVEAERK